MVITPGSYDYSTMEEAYINSVYVEDTARIYHMAPGAGNPVVIPGYEREHPRNEEE